MKNKLDQRIILAADKEFREDVARLEEFYETRGMSATIRRAILLAVRALPKAGVRHDAN